jgi:uncharacterized protein YecE (DUF72 family)
LAIEVGCCGFGMARARYLARFAVVEVQQAFYQPPRAATLARWRAEAPDGFAFTLKAWQPISHPSSSPTWRRLRERPERPEQAGMFRDSDAVRAAWRRTAEAAHALDARWVVFQCPARFTPSSDNISAMCRFFEAVDREGLAFAWEPRGAWPDETVRGLCRDLDLVHAVNPFAGAPATGGVAYFRLHGPEGWASAHDDAELGRLLDWCRDFDTAYCLFNNRAMVDDAERFAALAAAGEQED